MKEKLVAVMSLIGVIEDSGIEDIRIMQTNYHGNREIEVTFHGGSVITMEEASHEKDYEE